MVTRCLVNMTFKISAYWKTLTVKALFVSTYPLLIQLHQLLSDLGCVKCQAEAVSIQLRHQVLQHLFEGQASC